MKKNSSNPNSKSAYVMALEEKLFHKKAQLANAKTKVRRAAESGRIGVSDQLCNAEARADSALTAVDTLLQQLKDAGDDSWEDLKLGVDMAWEDLTQSIKSVVARF